MAEIKQTTHAEITDYIDNGNQVWSDELCEGFEDDVGQKSEDVIRIGFQNENGIKGRIGAAHEIFDAISEKELDIFCIAETNVKWTDKIRQEAMVAVKLIFGQGQVVGRSSK